MASINHHAELRLIITRYKPWAQCGVCQDVTKLRPERTRYAKHGTSHGRSAVIAARQQKVRPDRDAICKTRYKPWAQCRDSGKTTKRASRQGCDI